MYKYGWTYSHMHTHWRALNANCNKYNDMIHRKQGQTQQHVFLPTTIRVNSKPLLTDFLYTWLGRLAKPTYPSRFFCCCKTVKEKHTSKPWSNLIVYAHFSCYTALFPCRQNRKTLLTAWPPEPSTFNIRLTIVVTLFNNSSHLLFLSLFAFLLKI